MVVERKVLKSLEINLEKGIFKLNGEDMERIYRLAVDFDNGRWSLLVEKEEIYTQEATIQKVTE